MRLSRLFFFSFCLAPAAMAQAPAPAGRIARIAIVHQGDGKLSHPQPADDVSDDAVRAVMTEKVGDTYDPVANQKDQRAVRSMGVFGKVSSAVTADPAGGVDITYTVEDNPILQKIVFRANTPDSRPSIAAATLLSLMDIKPGQRLNARTLQRDLNRLTNPRTGYLHQQGYVANGIASKMDARSGVLTIRLNEAHIAQIVVTGNQKVKADTILRTMQSQAGDILNLNTLQGDMTRLQGTGLFQSVGPYKISTANRQVRVTVPVVEQANLAVAADPVLTPLPGEVRLEGTLRETSPARKRLVMLVLRTQSPGRPAQEFDTPRAQNVLVGPATGLHPANGERPALSAFQPGDAVIVVGTMAGPGKPLAAREIAAE